MFPFASFAQTTANKCCCNCQIGSWGSAKKSWEQVRRRSRQEQMKASCAPAVHTSSGLHLCQSTTLGRDTSTTPIASASGKEEGQEHSAAPPPPQGCLHEREAAEITSAGSPGAAWGWQSTSRSLPALEGQEYHVIFTFLRLRACHATRSSLFRF